MTIARAWVTGGLIWAATGTGCSATDSPSGSADDASVDVGVDQLVNVADAPASDVEEASADADARPMAEDDGGRADGPESQDAPRESSADASEAKSSMAVDAVTGAGGPVFPQLYNHGGPVLTDLEVVPIFYAADPLRESLNAFNDWIVGSEYWMTIGREYGLNRAHVRPAIEIEAAAPSVISNAQIGEWLTNAVGTSLPQPNANTLYVFFFPASTSIVSGEGTSCDNFYGYHSAITLQTDRFNGEAAYAVIARCGEPLDQLTITTNTASHEYLEGAMNPFPVTRPAWKLRATTPPGLDPWVIIGGDEVSDLCTNEPYDRLGGFRVQHAWSNAAAAAHLNPCQPNDPAKPYFVVHTSTNIYRARPGTTLSIPARAWSNLPSSSWEVGINTAWSPQSDFDGQATLSHKSVSPGDEITVNVTIPATFDAGGRRYDFTIDSLDASNLDFYHPWPISVIVE